MISLNKNIEIIYQMVMVITFRVFIVIHFDIHLCDLVSHCGRFSDWLRLIKITNQTGVQHFIQYGLDHRYIH